MGSDRVVLALQRAGREVSADVVEVYLISAAEGADSVVLQAARDLRGEGRSAGGDHSGRSLKARMGQAQKLGAPGGLLVGDGEMGAGTRRPRDQGQGAPGSVSSS